MITGQAAAVPALTSLGVFGGSFNPPHRGHQDLVRSLVDQALVDEIWVVPVYEHPFGKELAPFEDRLAMCRIAFAGHGERLRISDLERTLGGQSFTVRTLEELHRLRPLDELVLVVGADARRDFPHWRDFDRVQALARLLVAPRRGERDEGLSPIPAPADASSTEVRRRLARGEPTDGLLDPAVRSYAIEHALYDDEGARGSRRQGEDR